MAIKDLVHSYTPPRPRKALFLINFPKSSGCWPVDTWEWCASKNVTVLQAHHSQVLKLNLIWRKVLRNLIIFKIYGYIQNNAKRGGRKYCRNQKVLISKVARLRWRQTRAHPCGSVSILLGICDNIQTFGIFQPLLCSQRSCAMFGLKCCSDMELVECFTPILPEKKCKKRKREWRMFYLYFSNK